MSLSSPLPRNHPTWCCFGWLTETKPEPWWWGSRSHFLLQRTRQSQILFPIRYYCGEALMETQLSCSRPKREYFWPTSLKSQEAPRIRTFPQDLWNSRALESLERNRKNVVNILPPSQNQQRHSDAVQSEICLDVSLLCSWESTRLVSGEPGFIQCDRRDSRPRYEN